MDQADFIALGSDLQHRRRITGTLHQQLGDAVLHLPADGPPDGTAAAPVAEGLPGDQAGASSS